MLEDAGDHSLRSSNHICAPPPFTQELACEKGRHAIPRSSVVGRMPAANGSGRKEARQGKRPASRLNLLGSLDDVPLLNLAIMAGTLGMGDKLLINDGPKPATPHKLIDGRTRRHTAGRASRPSAPVLITSVDIPDGRQGREDPATECRQRHRHRSIERSDPRQQRGDASVCTTGRATQEWVEGEGGTARRYERNRYPLQREARPSRTCVLHATRRVPLTRPTLSALRSPRKLREHLQKLRPGA